MLRSEHTLQIDVCVRETNSEQCRLLNQCLHFRRLKATERGRATDCCVASRPGGGQSCRGDRLEHTGEVQTMKRAMYVCRNTTTELMKGGSTASL